jgi:hypothetical protein
MASLHEPHDERPDRGILDEQPTVGQLTLEVESLRTELHEARFHPGYKPGSCEKCKQPAIAAPLLFVV